MSPTTSTGVLKLASGLSSLPDSTEAVEQVCAQCAGDLGPGTAHLAFLFFTAHHIARAEEIARIVRRELQV